MTELFERIGLKMMEPQMDGWFGWIQYFVMLAVKSVLSYFTEGFGPDMGRFREYIGSSNVASLQTILIGAGIGLASIIFIFHLISVAMQSLNDSKESIPNLVFRYLVALLLISTGPSITEGWILGTAQEIYNGISEINPQVGGWDVYVDGLAESFTNAIATDSTIPGFAILTSILYIIFAVTLFLNFFKFALNIIQRYVSMCIIVLFFPVAASTYSSRSTSNVFNSYLRMLITEVIMLVLNEFFIIGFLSFIATGYAHGVIGLAFAIAFLRVSQTADSYLRSVGMSTGQTGQNLLDEAMGTATRLAFMGRQAKEGFRGARNMVGGIQKAAGLKDGDFGKFLSSQKLSTNERGGSGSPSASQNLKNFQNAGGHLNANDPNVVTEASRAAMTSGYRDLSTLPADVQQAVVNSTLGDSVAKTAEDAGLHNAKLDNVAVDSAGNIAANLSYGDGRNMPVNMTHTPPRDPARAIGAVNDSAGNRMYLSRAEGPSDVLNRAKASGDLSMSNPDVNDAIKQSMTANGNSALKNMPSDVQADAFRQVHGNGFNNMAAAAGLGISASDVKDISVDGSGTIKGNASIGGRQMDMSISNTPPKNGNEMLGNYKDDAGNTQYVSAKPSAPMNMGDDIEYEPVSGAHGNTDAVAPGNENVHSEQPGNSISAGSNAPDVTPGMSDDGSIGNPAATESGMDSSIAGADTYTSGVSDTSSVDEPMPLGTEGFEPEAPDANSGMSDGGSIGSPAATESGMDSSIAGADTYTSGVSDTSSVDEPMPFSSEDFEPEAVAVGSSSYEPDGDSAPETIPMGSGSSSTTDIGSEEIAFGADSSAGTVPESIPFETTGSQRSPSEIAAGVTLNDRWKSANAAALKGARFTPTSEGGMELRSYSNEVMMYQDPRGGQHYSYGTKMVNEADFAAGGTYETAGLKNVKIKGRNNDGSFTIEADGYDQGGNPIRQNYLCQDYAQNHGQKGRVVNGNRRHPSLVISNVQDKKRNIFGGKENK